MPDAANGDAPTTAINGAPKGGSTTATASAIIGAAAGKSKPV
jgi:hypothetical protein